MIRKTNIIGSILEAPAMYRLFTSLVGGDFRFSYVKEYVRPRKGDKVLDVACGPGDILEYLPGVDYLSIDKNQRYINAAIKRFANRGAFVCKKIGRELIHELSAFDIVLAINILHHLNDDEAIQLFELSKTALKPGGRLITFDGCYVKGQSWIEQFILSIDRGQYIRTKDQYLAIANRLFSKIKVTVRSGLIRIPYTHIIMECIA